MLELPRLSPPAAGGLLRLLFLRFGEVSTGTIEQLTPLSLRHAKLRAIRCADLLGPTDRPRMKEQQRILTNFEKPRSKPGRRSRSGCCDKGLPRCLLNEFLTMYRLACLSARSR